MAQRLYPTIQPSHYALTLHSDLEKFTLEGKETIDFTTQESLSILVFHAYELDVTKALLHSANKEIVPEKIDYSQEDKTVSFHFSEDLPAGELRLELEFGGILSEKAKGFYRSQYEVDGETKYMAVTQFEEIGARQAFVCIDEPLAKATFDISLIVKNELTAVSNTKEIDEKDLGNGLKQIRFETTPKMSTYILAFVVGELEYKETSSEGVRIRAYTTEGKKHLTDFSLDVSAKVLTFFNDYFATSYPLHKLDLFAIPDFDAGAMENWGAVTYRESILLIDEEKSSSANKQWCALTLAHELAHMWFGNLVTMQWWTYLWLNEGFACYIEYLCMNTIFPQWELWKQFSLVEHNAALKLDSLQFTHPIEVPIVSDQQVKEIFDEISYAKGANVIHMLASFLGEAVFREGLQRYLKKHAYGNTTTEDLWNALEEVSGKPVGKIMDSWVKKPGYPVLKIIEKQDKLEVTQQRFFANPLSQNDSGTIWNIPMRILQSESPEEKPVLVEKTQEIFQAGKDWTKLNAYETALVRVLYSDKLYGQVGSAIASLSLSPIDRMGVIRDAFDCAEAGLISSGQALGILQYYSHEVDYIVWSTIAGGLSTIENLIAHIDELDQPFREYVAALFTPIAQKMGWEKKSGEAHTDILLRSTVLHSAGKYGNLEIVEKAKSLFEAHREKGSTIDSDIRGTVFAIVAENGEEKEWQELVELYEKEPLQQEKNRYMLALTQFQEPHLILKLLDYFLTDNVRWQDKSRWIMAMFGNEKAQSATWEFVKKHWELFAKEYKGLHGFTRLIEGVGNMIGEDNLQDVRNFFKHHPTQELQLTQNQVIERIQLNTAWLKRDRDKLQDFFRK